MNYTEHAAMVPCGSDMLVGIVSVPETPQQTAVIVIVGGPQYRAGSHRQFVLLARKLAQAGYPVLRFDYRGLGDSGGQPRDFERITEDIHAAIVALRECLPVVRQVVLWGLCDGASAALLYCEQTRDPSVTGLCLLNPWVRSGTGLARVQLKYYYTRRLMQREFWMKVLRGGVAGAAVEGLARNMRLVWTGRTGAPKTDGAAQRTFQQRMADAWRAFDGNILLILSGQDDTAKEFLEHTKLSSDWSGALRKVRVERHDLPEADHTLSNIQFRRLGEDLTLAWLQRTCCNSGKSAAFAPVYERQQPGVSQC